MTPPTAFASSSRICASVPVLRMDVIPDDLRPISDFESMRRQTKRSPIEATTECAVSHAVASVFYDDNAACPCQGLTAISADVTLPPSVIDFPDSGKHLPMYLPVGRYYRCDILDDQHAMVANLCEADLRSRSCCGSYWMLLIAMPPQMQWWRSHRLLLRLLSYRFSFSCSRSSDKQ